MKMQLRSIPSSWYYCDIVNRVFWGRWLIQNVRWEKKDDKDVHYEIEFVKDQAIHVTDEEGNTYLYYPYKDMGVYESLCLSWFIIRNKIYENVLFWRR